MIRPVLSLKRASAICPTKLTGCEPHPGVKAAREVGLIREAHMHRDVDQRLLGAIDQLRRTSIALIQLKYEISATKSGRHPSSPSYSPRPQQSCLPGDEPTMLLITYAGTPGVPTSVPAKGEKPEY